jgi:hypothetical protein
LYAVEIASPTFNAPPIPVPPATTKAPVPVVVDAVILAIITLPVVAAIFIPFPPILYKFNAPASFRRVALFIPPSPDRVDPLRNKYKEGTPSLDNYTAVNPAELVFYANKVAETGSDLITDTPEDVII